MTPDKSLRELFNEALDMEDSVERARFLNEACGANLELRQRIDNLLQANALAGGFLAPSPEKPLGPNAAHPATTFSPQEQPGDRIGRYKLLQQIGEGGCGVVYMAEQQEPVQRRVALKVIKLGMDTKQVVARFEAERQALALMDHPNIAKVLDAGATESGRPFFVMELVRGIKITDFCDQQKLTTRERLELFASVCSAIQHAHQKGIIHRDLKPSNILVTTIDGVPVPRVIDFGIAKATTNQRLTDKTLFTAFDQFIGTPAYMSPEQAEMSGVDIDTRTDIYSLGVILYELLTGRTPFDTAELLRLGLDGIRRTICERDPAKPSTRLGALSPGEATTVAEARKTQFPSLLKLVRGDLDWIAMKCLEKDRNRRYATASDLAADIRRYIRGEPVTARAVSNLYRFRKLVGRNRAVSALSAILFLSLVAGAVFLIHSQRQLRHALDAEQKLRAVEVEALHASLLGQARAYRVSRQLGQRFNVLSLLARAARIRATLEVRNEAAAALALPDFRPLAEWPAAFTENNATAAFNPAFDAYVIGTPGGAFALHSVANQRLLRQFQSMQNTNALYFNFSPDGEHLAVTFGNGAVELWKLNGQKPDMIFDGGGSRAYLDFSADGKTIAIADAHGVFLKSIQEDGTPRHELSPASPSSQIQFIRFDPLGQRLAFARGQTVEVWSCTNSVLLWSAPLSQPAGDIVWSATGNMLAAASHQDRVIFLFDTAKGKVSVTLRGHHASPVQFQFHPDGRRLVSMGWDRTLRYWDTRTGRELLSHSAGTRALRFSPDGRQLAYSPGYSAVGILEVAPETIFKEFTGTEASGETAFGVNVSADGRFAATTTSGGLRIYDSRAGVEVLFLRRYDLYWAKPYFSPDLKRILLNIEPKGIFELPFQWREQSPPAAAVVSLGEPRQVGTDTNAVLDSIGYDGHSWVVTYGRTGPVELWPDGDPTKGRIIAGGRPVTSAMLSPDGAWAFSASYPTTDIRLWDARTGQTTGTLGLGRTAQAAFSPDGRWLMTSTDIEYRLWHVGSFKPGPSWPANLAGRPYGTIKFTLDSRQVVVEQSGETYQVLRMDDLAELVTVSPAEPLRRSSTAMDAAGDRFYVLSARGELFVWDIAQLRRELTALNLHWPDTPDDRMTAGSLLTQTQ